MLELNVATRKSMTLLCLVRNAIEVVQQSQWTDISVLTKYGWVERDPEPFDLSHTSEQDIANVFEDSALRISTGLQENLQISCFHNEDSKIDGKEYPKTNAKYKNIMNFGSGVIIACSVYGPDAEGKEQDPPVQGADVIPLKQWSDLTFLTWAQHAGANIKNLRYILQWDIVNDQTRDVLFDMVEKRGLKFMNDWPGIKIPMSDPGEMAVLGTPNGNGAAWLLANHKD